MEKALESTWVVAIALFVFPPLGLLLLWRNPRYSRQAKFAWTIVVLAYTALMAFVELGEKMGA